MLIVVNAPAIKEGGALSILQEFLYALEKHNINDEYLIFLRDDLNIEKINGFNIKLVRVKIDSLIERYLWDYHNLKKWLKVNNIKPDLIISLQNLCVNYKEADQIVYYHQPIPLYSYNWNPLSKNEIKYFFYNIAYPFLVKLFLNEKTLFITQLECIKKRFIERYKINGDKVIVIRPYSKLNFYNKKIKKNILNENYIHFIYPATPYIYKNHIILVKALKILKNINLSDNIRIHLTGCENDKNIKFVNEIHKCKLDDNFIFHGILGLDKFIELFSSVDAILFPSFLETFGLPLLEGAALGKKIICSDIDYAREVLNDYDNVIFIDPKNAEKWAEEIVNVRNKHDVCKKPLNLFNDEWLKLFDVIDKLRKRKI